MILNDYNEIYAHKMRDKTYLDAYLEACLAESEAAFYVGLRRAVQARENGFTWLAAQTGLGRESLYRALSPAGNPSFRTIRKVMQALGADERVLAHVDREAEAGEQENARTTGGEKKSRPRQALVSDALTRV